MPDSEMDVDTEFSFVVEAKDLTRLFVQHEDRIRLGLTSSTDAKDFVGHNASGNWSVFRDYIMEGFVRYRLRVSTDGPRAVIEVNTMGTNRDQYIRSHVRWNIKSSEVEILEELP